MPEPFTSTAEAVDFLLTRFGRELRIGAPLGLGKPNALLNELYERVRADPSLELKLFTALSLNPPRAKSDLERRFLEPFAKRQWGENYPRLRYADDADRDALPPNFQLHEFYVQAGAALHSPERQRHYQSLNYTHVPRALVRENIQAIVQLVAPDPRGSGRFSLSCNPDVTLDAADAFRRAGKALAIVGVIHPGLPFLKGEAEVEPDFFAALVDDPLHAQPLFALPRAPIDDVDHAIGFYASQTVVDGGTIQIGIGSLSDAIVASLICRHERNSLYRELVDKAWEGRKPPAPDLRRTETLSSGLYGLSEMVMDGFMHLRRRGILKRLVADRVSGEPTYLNGAFLLGSRELYDWLRHLDGDDLTGLKMGRVTGVNDLYDPDETKLRGQRCHPRFFNTCMQVTLLGGAASDTLENGGVVSGVGGQFNFVAMSHELEDSRSVLMLRSTRTSGGKCASNLVWSHGQLTLPRHLRDVVVTEYGIADVRGKSDEDTIKALLDVCDSRFQPGLLAQAKAFGKVDASYQIPDWAARNDADRVKTLITGGRSQGVFGTFALGSDFTVEEQRLLVALEALKEILSSGGALRHFLSSFGVDASAFSAELARMALEKTGTLKEKMTRWLLLGALNRACRSIRN